MPFGKLNLGLGLGASSRGTSSAPLPGIATAQGRYSAVNLTMPWRSPLVIPEGTINQNDRQQLVYAYGEIAA